MCRRANRDVPSAMAADWPRPRRDPSCIDWMDVTGFVIFFYVCVHRIRLCSKNTFVFTHSLNIFSQTNPFVSHCATLGGGSFDPVVAVPC